MGHRLSSQGRNTNISRRVRVCSGKDTRRPVCGGLPHSFAAIPAEL